MTKPLVCVLIVVSCLGCLSCHSATAASFGPTTVQASSYPNLQAAIDAIPPTGGTLVIDGQFPAAGQSCLEQTGLYGPCIFQRRNIRIRGDGVTSQIYAPNTLTNGLLILASDLISVKGVEFVGPWSPGQASGVGVAVRIDAYGGTPTTRVTVANCRVHNFSFDGLWARNGTAQVHLLHNESYGNQGNGIEVEAQNSTLLDNESHDNEHQGFEIYSGAQRLRVASNSAHNNLEGIKLIEDPEYATLSDIAIVGNSVMDNTDSGILYQPINATAPPGGLVSVTGNVVTGNKTGINLIQAGSGFVVAHNVVARNSLIDIYVSQPDNVVISSNVLTVLPGSPLPNYGIYIQPGSGRVELNHNLLNNSATIPVWAPRSSPNTTRGPTSQPSQVCPGIGIPGAVRLNCNP